MQKEGWEMYFLQLETGPQITRIGTEKNKLDKTAANPEAFVCENLCNLWQKIKCPDLRDISFSYFNYYYLLFNFYQLYIGVYLYFLTHHSAACFCKYIPL